MDTTMLAYLAGFFDGEGSVSIKRSGVAYGLSVQVTQLNPRPLIRLQEAFGGRLFRKPDKRGFRSIVEWQIVATRAEQALIAMRPFLDVKADEVDVALEFQERLRHPASERSVELAARDELYLKCRDLKYRSYDDIPLPVIPLVAADHHGARLPQIKKPKPLVHSRIAAPRTKPISKWGLGSHHRVVRPTPEVLKAFYEEYGAKAAALEYGTSLQTVYNWLRKHEIPIQGNSSDAARARMSAAQRRSWESGPRKPEGTVQPQKVDE